MTDWERVRRLRAKGMDWKTIAEDPKVGFTPAEGAGDPARALKALYLVRKSRSQKASKGGDSAEDAPARRESSSWTDWLPVLGIAFLLSGALWLLGDFLYPSWTVIIPIFPYVIALPIAGVAILGAVLVLSLGSLGDSWKKGVVAGVTLGIAFILLSSTVTYYAGIPNLSHTSRGPEPGPGWA
ncbi:MAG: hypothetical protein L3K09_08375, partial [Thermoplasmata archaeon]|nr:hypothetical protein [Thermoplasmata archaeon]